VKQKKILVADDNEHIRDTLTAILEDDGHTVWSAKNGSEALRKVREFSPDILILDIVMPELGGYDVCRTIKNDPQLNKTFILMLSAKGQVNEQELGKEAGADEYIVKPFNPIELLARINKSP